MKPIPRTLFDAEHRDFRESFRAFLVKEALPRRVQWYADGIIDREFWKLAAAGGFVGFSAPPEHGGIGVVDFRFNAVIDEEVAKLGAATDAFSLTNDVVMPYLLELTDEGQRERHLPGVVNGDTVVAIAMTEPGTGSDLRGIATKARRDGDGWRISGSKTFVTSGIQADLVVVAAQAEEGLTLFLVSAAGEGFERGRKLDKIGRRAQDTAEVFLDEVFVPGEDVLGEPGQGMRQLMRNLAQERLSIVTIGVAHAERALELTLEYVNERRAFGQRVSDFQATRFTLAEMATELSLARVYADRCIEALNAGELTAEQAAGAKFWCSELEFRVMDRCLQLHGGYGYMEEYEIARMWRDSRVQRIYGGTNEIMREIVGRSLTV